jgi:hypothetical protein
MHPSPPRTTPPTNQAKLDETVTMMTRVDNTRLNEHVSPQSVTEILREEWNRNGVRRRDDIFQALGYDVGTASVYIQHNMGNGLYFATSLPLALDYSAPEGCLLVVDWEGRGGRLNVSAEVSGMC